MALIDIGPTSGTTSGLKDRLDLKMAAILKISKYFRYIHFDIRYGQIVRNYARKSNFDVDDVIDDVTG